MSNNFYLKIKLTIYIFLCVINISCSNTKEKKLRIAAASSLQFPLKEIIKIFKEKQNIDCEIILGSSGKLAMQIENAAPFDVFLSANKKYSKHLISINKNIKKPQTFAFGKLIIASATIPNQKIIQTLKNNTFSKIAIPNPKFAPYGEMSIEFLKNNKLYNALKNKFVYGENVMQTNQYLYSNTVDLAFTSLSTIKETNEDLPNIKHKEIDNNLYTPNAHQAVIISKTKLTKEAKLFVDFLLSKTGQNILKNYGYGTLE